jgi:hypothetical protein
MTLAAGPFAIAAALLVAGGATKAARPGDTANALRAVHLPASALLVRLGGLTEAAVGIAALAVGDRTTAILVAISYAAFAGFVAVALRSGAPISSCGCFGKADTPPTRLHVIVDLAAVVAAAVVAIQPPAGLGSVLAGQPLAGVPFVALVASGVGLSFLTLSSLPRTLAAIHLPGATSD